MAENHVVNSRGYVGKCVKKWRSYGHFYISLRPMNGDKDILLGKLRSGETLTGREQLKLVMILSVPAILAQLSMCMMTYIDAAMVGRLGSAQSAGLGLVSSTTWILGGFCYANSSSFTVQIAHKCGAKDFAGARRIFCEGLATVLLFAVCLAAFGVSISSALPQWLGGGEDIIGYARDYFRIYAFCLPFFQLAVFAEGALISTGNIKVSSATSVVMCVLDVLFNYLFIYVLGLGVKGAALGTGLATLTAAIFMHFYIQFKSPELKGRGLPFRSMKKETASQAWTIAWPLWLQNIVSRGAYIAATVVVAPLGTIAIAANSFAITAEGFCYMPGYGVQDAAITLIGQSLGAKRRDMARRFTTMTIAAGASMMTALAVLMYAFAPQIMGLLSVDPEVIALGAKCLRIEAFAETMFAVSIVANGCCTGAGDTLVPSSINLLSMWFIRIGLAILLIPHFGLIGYWIGMATELNVKGIIFAIRVRGHRWMDTRLTRSES